jgi:hypothetical protein
MSTEFQFERFIKAVHRRMVLLRAAERLGLCLLGGCGVLLVLMPILIWRGQSGGELALGTLAVAAVAGLIWGLASRPGVLAAAIEADRQLRLSDLLGTALMLRRSKAAGDLEATVLALAEARCGQASPSAVVLNRFGARGWGGIGLAAAMVGGLCLLGPDSARSQARAAAGPKSWQEVERENEKGNASKFVSKVDMRHTLEGNGSDEDPASSNDKTQDDSAGGAATGEKNPDKTSDGGNAGAGAGAAQSGSKAHTTATVDPVSGASKTDAHATDTAGGGGAASEAGNNTTGAAGSTAGQAKGRRPAPVWQARDWPADREAARAAIRNGAVPDGYREMVRDYFEQE